MFRHPRLYRVPSGREGAGGRVGAVAPWLPPPPSERGAPQRRIKRRGGGGGARDAWIRDTPDASFHPQERTYQPLTAPATPKCQCEATEPPPPKNAHATERRRRPRRCPRHPLNANAVPPPCSRSAAPDLRPPPSWGSHRDSGPTSPTTTTNSTAVHNRTDTRWCGTPWPCAAPPTPNVEKGTLRTSRGVLVRIGGGLVRVLAGRGVGVPLRQVSHALGMMDHPRPRALPRHPV